MGRQRGRKGPINTPICQGTHFFLGQQLGLEFFCPPVAGTCLNLAGNIECLQKHCSGAGKTADRKNQFLLAGFACAGTTFLQTFNVPGEFGQVLLQVDRGPQDLTAD